MDTAQDIIIGLRQRHKLTDQAIADLAETTQPTINRIRAGRFSDCASSLYIRLARVRERLDADNGHTAANAIAAPDCKSAELGDIAQTRAA